MHPNFTDSFFYWEAEEISVSCISVSAATTLLEYTGGAIDLIISMHGDS